MSSPEAKGAVVQTSFLETKHNYDGVQHLEVTAKPVVPQNRGPKYTPPSNEVVAGGFLRGDKKIETGAGEVAQKEETQSSEQSEAPISFMDATGEKY